MKKPACTLTVLAFVFVFGLLLPNFASADTYVSSVANGNATWTSQNNAYRLTGNVVVSSGQTLTIQAGTIVHLNGYQIQVYGTLNVQGSSGSKVSFLSDENSNSQIYFASGSSGSCVIDNAVLYSVPVVIGGGMPRISNSYFAGGSSTAITVNGGDSQITGNVINVSTQNCININYATVSITSNVLSGNPQTSFGIYNLGGTITVLGNSITNCYTGIYSSGQGSIEQNTIIHNTNDAIASRNMNHEIRNNALAYNTVGISGDGNMQNNAIINNQYGLWGPTASSTITYNNIYGNDENVHLTETNVNVSAVNNWWGTTDNASIYAKISDYHIHDNLGYLTYEPYLASSADVPAVPSSVTVPSVPPTPSVSASPTPSPTPNDDATATPNPVVTVTPYPYETYTPTPTPRYITSPTPTEGPEYGGYTLGDITNFVVIICAVALSASIILVIHRKFSRSKPLPLPPPPPPS